MEGGFKSKFSDTLLLYAFELVVLYRIGAPARYRPGSNDLGDDAEQALRAAARSGLELVL